MVKCVSLLNQLSCFLFGQNRPTNNLKSTLSLYVWKTLYIEEQCDKSRLVRTFLSVRKHCILLPFTCGGSTPCLPRLYLYIDFYFGKIDPQKGTNNWKPDCTVISTLSIGHIICFIWKNVTKWLISGFTYGTTFIQKSVSFSQLWTEISSKLSNKF